MEEPKTLDSRYRLVAEIGRGPMATVYEAIGLESGQQIVVKIFQSRFQTDPNFAIKFREHLKVIVEIDHNNLEAILDYGLADGGYYLVMEAHHELTLRTIIAEQGALSSAQAVYISKQICAAVNAIHEQGLVHRDLKPENVLLLPDGQVKVTDVGFSSMLSETGLSKTDVMVNGVGYMSPEQARGKPVGPESDIYGIGVLLFEMLTERLPFESSDAWTVVKMHAQDIPPSTHDINPKVPVGLSRIVDQALQKERSGRFASAAEMETALTELPQSEGFWWPKLPMQISSRESLSPLTLLASYRQHAPIRFRQLGTTIAATLKRSPPSRRVLTVQYLASFLIAFVILFSISGHVLDSTSKAANDDSGHQSMINAHRFNDRRDQSPKISGLPLALTSAVLQPLNNGQESVTVDPGPTLNEGAASTSSAGATGGETQVNDQGGGEKGGKGKGKHDQGGKAKGKDDQGGKAKGKDDQGGKAKGKDDQGGKGKAKGNDNGKKNGQNDKGKGNNNVKGKGASGKKK